MSNNKYTLLTSGYSCSCPEQRHVPKEECLEAAQSVLRDIITTTNAKVDTDVHSNADFKSDNSYTHIPDEVLDNRSDYSPCGCFLWKERSKILYADPKDDTIQCSPMEWAQLVCKQPQDDDDSVDGDSANTLEPSESSRAGHELRAVEVEKCNEKRHNKLDDHGGEEHDAAIRGYNKELFPLMREGKEEGDKTQRVVQVGGFPTNYIVGDQVFPSREDFCLDWWYYRPLHLSNDPDFCIGFSSSKDGGDGKATIAVLKPCHELDVTNEYWYYSRSEGKIINRDYFCLTAQVGKDIGVGPLPLVLKTCSLESDGQRWYLHEDGVFQNLVDESFFGISGCDISENVAIVSSHDKKDGCNKWLPYTMIYSKEYGPEDVWAVFGVFIPLLIIETFLVIACCLHSNNKNRGQLNEYRRRHLNDTGRVRTSSCSGRDIPIDALSTTAARRPS